MIKKQKIYTAGSLDVLEWNFDFHNLMLSDSLRMDAYKKAIFEVIKPGMIVCDVGLGTGILTKWALQAGAQCVYGIEMNVDILDNAIRDLSSFGDKFIPVEGVSFDVDLPEKVDCIISEILGNVMDNEDCVSILEDAEKRFLKKEGIMLPQSVTSFITPVSFLDGNKSIKEKDIALAHVHSPLVKKMQKLKSSELYDFYYDALIDTSQYLAKSKELSFMKQGSYKKSYSTRLDFKILKTGDFTGFKAYFTAQLSDKTKLNIESAVDYSPSWKHAYFPIEKTIKVKRGDKVELRFTRFENNTYRWEGVIRRKELVVANFKQELKELFK